MLAIFTKELNAFFTSTIAYLVVGIYLLINGLLLWIFKDNLNILTAGFADLNSYFYIAPILLMFLIPAITMKSFAEEYQSGTIEILKTKPLTDWQIILGKFFAALVLVIMALLPTLTYVYTVYQLGNPVGNLDIGSTVGSYIGLLFLAASYVSIGLFTSTLSKNQIIAFIIGAFIIFILYMGVDALGSSLEKTGYSLQQFGINEHYKSMRRGVIDSRDILYFISLTFFFLFITKQQLKNE